MSTIKSIHINASTKERLAVIAKQSDSSVSAVIRGALIAITQQRHQRQHDQRVQVKARVDEQLWAEALEVLDGTGVSMSEAIREELENFLRVVDRPQD